MKIRTHGAILFRNTLAYEPQHAENFKKAISDAVTFAQKNAPQQMVQVYIDENLGLAYSFQLYETSRDIVRHWKVSDNAIDEVMKYCEVVRLEVYGNPSSEVVDGILGSLPKEKVTFIPELVGFYRFS